MKKPLVFTRPRNHVSIAEISVTYQQPSDSCESDGMGQLLKISTANAAEDSYVVIETERWAVEPQDAEWLAQVIRELCGLAKDPEPMKPKKPAEGAEDEGEE
jgi:hypothetical protein